MKFKLKLTFLVFFMAALLGLFVWQAARNSASAVYEKSEKVKQIQSAEVEKAGKSFEPQKKVLFENVSFTYDTTLFSQAEGEFVEASPLEDASSKPEGVYPKHINFIFERAYAGEREAGEDYYSSLKIHVYPIREYKQAYAFYKIDSEVEFEKIRKLTAKSLKIAPSGGEKQLPYVPFADAHQAFCSKSKVINFQNGTGLLYLTQWQQDERVINNAGLELVYQGISDNNKYFVLMEFDISAKGLPQNDEAKYPDKYRKLDDTSKFLSREYQQLYKKYALETAVKLDAMPSEKFTPNLNKIENLIRSFSVK